MKVKVNPVILKWARESLNLSFEDVSMKINKDIELVKRWESGEDYPTYVQLENLAYGVFKRPIAVFFFPVPPKDLDIEKSFRTLPHNYFEKLSPSIIKQLRLANIKLLNLYEVFENRNKRIERFNDFKQEVYETDLDTSLSMLRDKLEVKLSDQYAWKDLNQALTTWRNSIENMGIFIFKEAFRDNSVSGFCVYDETFPMIIINNTMSKSRQIFTLFHEFAHLLYQTSGIDFTEDIAFSEYLEDTIDLERNCNTFAGNFLVPDEIVHSIVSSSQNIKISIENYAQNLKVSREVIARRLLDHKRISFDDYNSWRAEWLNDMTNKKTSDGGDYYNNIGVYLSQRYATEVFRKYYEGNIGISEASDYLNVKERNFASFESHFLK